MMERLETKKNKYLLEKIEYTRCKTKPIVDIIDGGIYYLLFNYLINL